VIRKPIPALAMSRPGTRDVLSNRHSPASDGGASSFRAAPGLRRSVVMSVSSEVDPQVARGRRGLRAWRRRAAARLTGPARLSTPITRLRNTAMTCDAAPVRTWESSSRSVSAGLFGLPLVRLRADEVRVASAGKAGQFPAVDRLSGRRLIYLGEANSKAMLYDPLRRVTFSVPAASLVLELRGR
jgi:hypothetical protein